MSDAFGLRIGLEIEGHDPLDGLVPWMPAGWLQAGISAAEACDRLYRVGWVDGTELISISVEGEELWRTPDAHRAIDFLESDLHHFIAAHSRTDLFLHAGVVRVNGKLLVLPGRSYSGKSTLVRALCAHGAEYYSDDYAVVDREGWVAPFPRYLRLREANGGPRNRIDPASEGWIGLGGRCRIGMVAALRYQSGADFEVDAVSSGSGALELLNNAVAARSRPSELLEAVSRAVDGARFVKGTRGEAEDAAVRLLAILAE